MRLHRFLAVLVIALSFNVAAPRDARASFECHDLLSAHDNDNKTLQKAYMIYARGYYEGFFHGGKNERIAQLKKNNSLTSKRILPPSMLGMKSTEIYYNLLRYCRNDPSSAIKSKLYRFWLDNDFEE